VRRALALWGPVAGWMALIFGASSQNGGAAAAVPLADWITHGSAYLVLAALLARALSDGFRARLSRRRALLAFALAALYGVSDEWHQSFVPGREATLDDVAKDAAGAALGALLASAVTSPKREHA
jgi:VanZ family protein